MIVNYCLNENQKKRLSRIKTEYQIKGYQVSEAEIFNRLMLMEAKENIDEILTLGEAQAAGIIERT